MGHRQLPADPGPPLKTVPAVALAVFGTLTACSPGAPSGPPLPSAPTRSPPPSATAPGSAAQVPDPTTVVPIFWSDLHLTGSLIFVEGAQRVRELELESGTLRTVFETPLGGWVTAASVSPDAQTIAVAYAEPPAEGEVAAYTGIYLLPIDGSTGPTPLLLPSAAEEAFFNPTYSPDGKSLYLVHLVRTPDDPNQAFRQSIERLWLVDGRLDRLAEDAFWPRASPDGSWLAYVTINPLDFSNNLLLAKPDGTEARSVIPPSLLPYVDSPVFSLDSEWLYFSAVGTGLSKSPGFLAEAFGVLFAEAHSLPSDWWRVPVQGGSPERLTELGQSNLIGAISPDGLHLAFLSSTGLYAMNLDGSQITAMLNTWSSGGLDWIP